MNSVDIFIVWVDCLMVTIKVAVVHNISSHVPVLVVPDGMTLSLNKCISNEKPRGDHSLNQVK